MGIYTKEEQFDLIRKDPTNLKDIENQYEEVCLEAVKNDGYVLKYVKHQTNEICMEAVKTYGEALQYVKDKTYDICMQAIKTYGIALKWAKNQTLEMCLEAVRQNGIALEYVENQTQEICIEAIKENSFSIYRCRYRTPMLCFYALLNDFNLLNYETLKNEVEIFMKEKNLLKKKVFNIFEVSYTRGIDLENSEYEWLNLSVKTLEKLEEFIVGENAGNYFVLRNSININEEILKKIALSNNSLILVKDNEVINPSYQKFANEIIKEEQLLEFDFDNN